MQYAKSRYFKIEELMPPDVFKRYGEQCWMFLNPLLILSIDALRELYNDTITVNDYLWGGNYTESGFRPSWSKTGGWLSQHRLGNAIDAKGRNKSKEEADRLRTLILSNRDKLPHITAIEDGRIATTWAHLDVRNCSDNSRIWVVRP